MDLSFDEAQRAIKTTARDFFQTNCPISLVRELEGRAPGYSPDLWRKMAGLGWLGITFPEAYGGAGESFLTQYVIYEEMGRFLVPSPHLGTAVIGGETILRAGSDDQKKRLLPAIAKGEITIAPAMTEPDGSYGAEGVHLAATAQGSSYRLNGTKLLVPYADSADYLLVLARTKKGGDPTEGITLFLVERKTPGISIELIPNIAGERLCAVTFGDVTVPQSAVAGTVDQGWQAIWPVLSRASVLVCAMVCGASERVLDMTVNYAKDRVQFGRPVGGFQAVQYLCTDVAIDSATVNLLSKQAAWRIDQNIPADREVAIAKAAASKAAFHMTRQAQEVHAGVSFMLEHDLQLYTRHAKVWETTLGDVAYHHEAWAVAAGL